MRYIQVIAFMLLVCTAALAQEFKAGVAKRDITPQKPMPMWGYGARHDALSQGVLDPLHAKCVVFEVGETKVAIVTMDIGRGPTAPMMDAIRKAVLAEAGIQTVLISGSHTHHGPVIELLDAPEKGQGKFQDCVDYAKELPLKIIDVIKDAASHTQPARIGWGSANIDMNRNRQAKSQPKSRDTELSVVRVDALDGTPLTMLINYQAHPTRLPAEDLRFSAEWPGQMMNAVESKLGAQCMFVQGASGDMSIQTTEETKTIELFGAAIAQEALKVNEAITTRVPERPSIKSMDESFSYKPRTQITSPASRKLLSAAFFPELTNAFMDEMQDDEVHPHLTSVLLNGELYWVGVSGEYFCDHSNRLKERARGVKVIFDGYCNGHHMYFPTIEAASEGGYGADAAVSWVPLGAGEEVMNKALLNLYTLQGKF
jgi:hypothetical protein